MIARVRPIPTPTGPLPRFIDDLIEDPWAALQEVGDWLLAGLRVLLAAAVVGAFLLLLAWAWRAMRDRRLARDARRIRILPPPEVTGAPGAEMLWLGLHALLRPWWRRVLFGQPHLAWELVARPERVEVGVWIPRQVPLGLVERAVEASWPGAGAVEAEEDPVAGVTDGTGHVEVTELALARSDRYPIAARAEGALALALAGLTQLTAGEAAAIQVAARPATSASRRRLVRAAGKLKAESRRARRAARGHPWPPALADPALQGDVRAVLDKAASPLWSCTLRVAVSSPARERARGRIHALAGGFAVFEARNGFRRRRVPGARRRIRRRLLSPSYLLSVPELAPLATLPQAGAVAGLERAAAKTIAPPWELPVEGKALGAADHPGLERNAAISVADARHHIHIIGETGTGKSTLLARMVLQDVEASRSAVVIDPKGDLVNAILARLPAGAEDRTCVIDPEDPKHAVGLDVLSGTDRDLVVDHTLGVFRRIYEPWWGPRTDDVMRAACLTLTRMRGATLAEIPLLLTDAEWRLKIRDRLVGDATGLATFWNWYERIPEGQRAQHIAPLLNKLRAFLLRGPVRAIVGQSSSRLDIPRLLNSGGLLLVRIPKGTLGEETSRLLGAFVIARVWQACMRRATVEEEERPDTSLYVDEMHNYLVLPRSFEDLLAEARGYRLSLVLAHQHSGQLNKEMREALAANARTKVVFTCSPEDAFFLQRHFTPQLTEHDLSRLATYQAACRPCIGGGQGPAFTLKTLALPEGSTDRAAEVREASGKAYGRSRTEVEEEIWDRQRQAKTNLLPDPPRAPNPTGASAGGSAGVSTGGSGGVP
ncbi:MAG: type IV secretory system conjugative DNA transfer family protein [Actinomycetota bacterium]